MNGAIKVNFKGTEYWLLAEPDGDFGPLAPLHHCNAEGSLTPEAAFGPEKSFAHVFADGLIYRFGEVIGTREDLIPVNQGVTQ